MTDEAAVTPPVPPFRTRDFITAVWLAYQHHKVSVVAAADAKSVHFEVPDTEAVRTDMDALRDDGAAVQIHRWEHGKRKLRAFIAETLERAELELSPERRAELAWIQQQQDNARIAAQSRNIHREHRRALQQESEARELQARMAAVQRAQRKRAVTPPTVEDAYSWYRRDDADEETEA